ncbi:MAG: peptidyl-prolyl cis-trans isomerase [Epsilonproteobacteria bacterium]|nr:peptidyl-prolyl cis-trans isomerase [Campylobacterota bacterium]
MGKIFLIFIFALVLNAKMVDGVAVVVEGSAITLYEIKQEMKTSNVKAKMATDILIRKTLEKLEIRKRKISATRSEVYDDIKRTASRNKLSVSAFYEAVRNSNGLTSEQLKERVREKLLSQKLYSSIAYKNMSEPTQEDIKAYYKTHKDIFMHPSTFQVIIYKTQNQARLKQKVLNPMFYSPDIQSSEQTLPYDRISPDLANLLQNTSINHYTPIVPDGNGGYMSFYLKGIESAKEEDLSGVKNKIINMIMAEQRENVLSDYFQRLRQNANIEILRQVK